MRESDRVFHGTEKHSILKFQEAVMKICLLSYRGNMYCGGQGVYVYYLSKWLSRMGHEVHLVQGPPYTWDTPWCVQHRVPN